MYHKEGYLLCVFGETDKYYKLAIRLITNIRLFDSLRKIVVLTDDVNRYVWPENIIIKQFCLEMHLHEKINNDISWHKYGFYPKLFQSFYTPFEHTMYLDVDMIFKKDFQFIWDEYYSNGQPILIPGKSDKNNRSPPDWHWNNIDNVIGAMEIPIPQTFSTLMVYEKDFSTIITKNIVFVLDNLMNWGVKNYFCGGYPDEIVYSIIMGFCNFRVNEPIHQWLVDAENCDPTNKVI